MQILQFQEPKLFPQMSSFELSRFVSKQELTYGKNRKSLNNMRIFQVGPGWNYIISELILELLVVGWNKNIIAVRQHNNGKGVFKISDGNDVMLKLIKGWEDLSLKVCDCCGSTDGVRVITNKPSILKSVECESCREEGEKFEQKIRNELVYLKK